MGLMYNVGCTINFNLVSGLLALLAVHDATGGDANLGLGEALLGLGALALFSVPQLGGKGALRAVVVVAGLVALLVLLDGALAPWAELLSAHFTTNWCVNVQPSGHAPGLVLALLSALATVPESADALVLAVLVRLVVVTRLVALLSVGALLGVESDLSALALGANSEVGGVLDDGAGLGVPRQELPLGALVATVRL